MKKEVERNSALDCMQGVWQPINSQNEDLIEYIIYDSFNSVSIRYTENRKPEGVMFTINGFYNFDNGYRLSDSLKASELQSNGNYFVWFFAEDVSLTGWARLGGVQTDLICEGDIIEMSDNAMTVLEKRSYLPYTAYHQLKEQEKKDNRDYITKFNILNKLKKAKVTVDKTYFYNDTNENTKRKAFVVKGDQVIIDKINEDWVKVAYEGEKVTTEGWLKRSDVEIID